MKKLIPILLIAVFVFAQSPDWYSKGQLKGYDRQSWIIGVGEGSTAIEAQSSAQAAVAAQLKVSIESAVQVFTSESMTKDGSEITEDFQKLTKAVVKETVQGIEIIKNEKIDKRNYAFAALNKDKYFSGLKSELKSLQQQAIKYQETAISNIEDGFILPAIESFSAAYETILIFYTKKSFYEGVSGVSFSNMWGISPAELLSGTVTSLSNVYIDILSGDNQSGKMGTWLQEPVIINVYYKTNNEKIPIKNLSLLLKYSDGTIGDRLLTNASGQAEAFIRAIPNKGDRGKVTAEIRLSAVSSSFKKYLNNTKVSVNYKIIESSPISVMLHIKTDEGIPLPKLKRKVTKSLGSLGFLVSEDALFTLNGVVSEIDEKEVDGPRGKQFVIKTELNLELSATASGEIYSSADFKGTGLSPKNKKMAFNNSLTKISIKKKNLAEMLTVIEKEYSVVIANQDKHYFTKANLLYSQGKLRDALVLSIKIENNDKANAFIETIRKELQKKEEIPNKLLDLNTADTSSLLHKVKEEIKNKNKQVEALRSLLNNFERTYAKIDVEKIVPNTDINSNKLTLTMDCFILLQEDVINKFVDGLNQLGNGNKVFTFHFPAHSSYDKVNISLYQESIDMIDKEFGFYSYYNADVIKSYFGLWFYPIFLNSKGDIVYYDMNKIVMITFNKNNFSTPNWSTITNPLLHIFGRPKNRYLSINKYKFSMEIPVTESILTNLDRIQFKQITRDELKIMASSFEDIDASINQAFDKNKLINMHNLPRP